MKRIATITFHCSLNYGSALQAYALQQVLINHGYYNRIIDYYSADYEQYRIIPRTISSTSLRRFARNMYFFRAYFKRMNAFEQFQKKMLLRTERFDNWEKLHKLNSEFNVFICGSDQIWNIDCTKGANPAYFLGFVDEDKIKIAYGPSLGKTQFRLFQDYSIAGNLINKIDYISVREANTIPVLKEICEKKIEHVVDPTLLLNAGQYPVKRPAIKDEENQFIFVYKLGSNNEIFSYVNELSAAKNLPIYYVTRSESRRTKKLVKGKDMFGCTPQEFLWLIQNARYVVTDSFHAVVFSVLFHKQFCAFNTGSAVARIPDFLSNINLLDRMSSQNFNIDAGINYLQVDLSIDELRNKSLRFLLNALEEENENRT